MNVVSDELLAERLASKTQLDQDTVKEGLSATLNLMKSKLTGGQGVKLRSFADVSPVDAGGNPTNGGFFIVPSPQAASAIAGTLQCSESEAEKFLDNVVHVLRDTVLDGDRLDLIGLFSLNVVEEKAKAVVDDAGVEQFSHARRVISFTTSEQIKQAMGGTQSLTFVPDPALKAQIKSLKTLAILLLVRERDFFVKTMEFHFERAGWDVQILTSTQEAVEKIESGSAFLSLVDGNVADYQTYLEKLKCTLETGLIPVISIHGSATDPKKTDTFRICADQMVIEPFEVKSLLDKADNELARVAEEEAIFRQEVRLQFPTTDDMVNRANQLAATLFEQSGLSDEGQVALSAAFREAVGNAAQHGNRYRRDKVIEALYLLDNEKITINVTDMGKGFDHQFYTQRGQGGDALSAARERHMVGKLGGLGIMLMTKCTDKLEYNDAGNSVTLSKLLTSGS